MHEVKTNAASQKREICEQSADEPAQSIAKSVARCFVGSEYGGKAVQNQIAIEFTQNAYIETRTTFLHIQTARCEHQAHPCNIIAH